MLLPHWGEIAWIALSIALGGALRGFTGFGFAIAATPLLSLVLPPVEAVAIVMLLGFGIGLTDLRIAFTQADRAAVAHLALGMAVATPLGVLALTVLPADKARMLIAMVLAAASALLLSGFRFREPPGGVPAAGLGALSGVFNGLAAMPGPPVIAYCLALPHRPERIRATMMLYFLATSAIGLGSALFAGLISWRQPAVAALAFPVLLAGVKLGSRAFAHFGEHYYRAVSVVSLVVLTALVLVRAIAEAFR